MNINNVEFDFNSTTDVGLETIENAMEKMLEVEKNNKSKKIIDVSRTKVQAIKTFFSVITDKDVLKGETSPYLVQFFYEDFAKQCELQRTNLKEEYFKKKYV